MGGWIFLGYVAVWLVYGWKLSITLLDGQIRHHMKLYPLTHDNPQKIADEERVWALFFGYMLALAWPVVMPARGAYRLLAARGLHRTPIELEYEERKELERLRALAREHGLPMPEVR